MKKIAATCVLLLLISLLIVPAASAEQKESTEVTVFSDGVIEMVLGTNQALLKTKRLPLYLPVRLHFGDGLGGYTTVTQSVAVADVTYKYYVYKYSNGNYYSATIYNNFPHVKATENKLYGVTVHKEAGPFMSFESYGTTYGGHISGGLMNITYYSDIYYDQHNELESKTQSEVPRAFFTYISADD